MMGGGGSQRGMCAFVAFAIALATIASSSPAHALLRVTSDPSPPLSAAGKLKLKSASLWEKSCESATYLGQKQFFLVGAGTAIGLARIAPAVGKTGGLLRPELTVGSVGVGLIFFGIGLGIKLRDLRAAAANLKLNFFTQFFMFGFTPALGWALRTVLKWAQVVNATFLDGMMALMCLPTTVNMCVILTGQAGGSLPSSVFNAVLGNLLGIVLTPLLVYIYMGESLTLPIAKILRKLSVKVLLPFCLGLAAQEVRGVRDAYSARKRPIKKLSELILISIIYNSFCDTFSSAAAPVGGIPSLVCVLVGLHAALLSIIWATGEVLGLPREEKITAAFCGSQKTLAFGIPLLTTLFAGSPNLSALTTPLLLYHPLQLLMGSVFAGMLKRAPHAEDPPIAAMTTSSSTS
jgi:sodium/bile acid cotransporter 7